MKNRLLIIKIAFGVSAAALLFSLITLIRSMILGARVIFPVIQAAGSAAVFVICFLMLRMDLSAEDEEDDEETESLPEKTDGSEDTAGQETEDLYQKYDLSEFEEQKDKY